MTALAGKGRAIHSVFAVLLLALIVCFLGTACRASDRVALLIGNANFANSELQLANPINDVVDVAEALSALGFQTQVLKDGTRAQMLAQLSDFSDLARGAEAALFFFAGHGAQYYGENYLLGTEFSGSSTSEFLTSSVTLSDVRRAVEDAKPKVSLIFVDACRDAPFEIDDLHESGLARASGGAGLMFVYSTDPGNVALDGSGRNSVFTQALLNHINTPNLDVRLLLGRVRQQVVIETDGRQVPWVEEALLQDFSMRASLDQRSPSDPISQDMRDWQTAVQKGSYDAIASYLSSNPEGVYASIAHEILQFRHQSPDHITSSSALALVRRDPVSTAAALSMLGYPTDTQRRGLDDFGLVASAFDRYQSVSGVRGEQAQKALVKDATQVSVMLASTTAQRMRTDLVALRSIERTLKIAEDAFREIEEIATQNPDAEPLMAQARKDIEAIYEARRIVLERLDASRIYYSALLEQSVLFIPKDATLDLLQLGSDVRSLTSPTQAILRDSDMFLRHVKDVRITELGSMAWLTDFMQ